MTTSTISSNGFSISAYSESAYIVAIDGPSGSGKGTISQFLAQRLGFHLLDSGALYRLVALDATQKNISVQDEVAVTQVATNLDVKFDAQSSNTRVLLAGQDVTDAIRSEDIGMKASQVAAIPAVRVALLQRQRDFAQAPGLIADGRDMGTVVFPSAPIKFFLTASAQARAERRYKQLQQKNLPANFPDILADIQARDDRDMNRSAAPLKPADDAILVDSTQMSIQQVLDFMLEKIQRLDWHLT